MYKILIEIDKLPKSLNRKMRSHHLANHTEMNIWKRLIAEKIKKRPDKPLIRARISVVRHFYRYLDFDGFVGSMKPVIDALVHNEILSDDSWQVVGAWNVHQRFRSKSDGPLLEILVQEMPAKVN